MEMDDYKNFEKPLLGRYGAVRMLIASAASSVWVWHCWAAFSLGSSVLATGGACSH